jgi:hypothetical protein
MPIRITLRKVLRLCTGTSLVSYMLRDMPTLSVCSVYLRSHSGSCRFVGVKPDCACDEDDDYMYRIHEIVYSPTTRHPSWSFQAVGRTIELICFLTCRCCHRDRWTPLYHDPSRPVCKRPVTLSYWIEIVKMVEALKLVMVKTNWRHPLPF